MFTRRKLLGKQLAGAKACRLFGFVLASNFNPIVTCLIGFLVVTERILIVEDEQDVADLLAHHLKAAGFIVEIANSGRTALNAVKNQPPTLVVLDLMLPEMSGLDLCRILKSDPRTNKIAVVILSAKIEEIDRVLGFELGADDYVVKPFSPREFVLRIQAILRRRAASPHDHDCLQVGEIF